jgi:hypothetical protein
MSTRTHRWTLSALLATLLLYGCGGGSTAGGSSGGAVTPVANVQPIAVNGGPTGQIPNMVLTSVTICVPGTGTCQTIPNVQVDTGSSGLRLLASAVTIALPPLTSAASGDTYSECAPFADGVVWGALATADVQLAGETAHAIPVQVIQDNGGGPGIAPSCSAQGAPLDSLALLGANGIVGVGLFLQDCGPYCVGNTAAMYFDCPTFNRCTDVTMPLALQVGNPAAFFAQDNNGVILQLAAIPANGAPSAAGNMIFGIGTQANNVLSAAVIAVPDSGATAGDFTATYNGIALANSFFDSGSTGLFFDDASIAACTPGGVADGFYCPGTAAAISALPISVAISGSNGASASVSALVANAEFLFTQPGGANLNAFGDLAGPAGATLPNAFDFGVPFFFGRSVFTAFEQRTTAAGAGPYFAFQAYP